MDKGYFKDALIGYYEFDIAYIYFMDKHSMLHKTLAISDPTSENYNEITAYLKISISIAATGDEQVQITDDTGPDSEDVLMPLSIRPEFYQIIIRIFSA
jgi:hypothetical protein